MSVALSAGEIIKATKGKLLQGDPRARVKGVSIDSRNFKTGELFVAIKGENHDGHAFVGQIERSASAVVVSRKDLTFKTKIPVIFVKDTTEALGRIAFAHRKKFKIPVIAITGSSGKTTTKDMLAEVLRSKYKVLSSVGTQNNQIGVPLTLLKLSREHEVAVLELGTNRFGDIRWLTEISKPAIAIYTTIGESHLECLKTPEGVLKEKLGLARFMAVDGKVILNLDNPYLAKVKSAQIRRKIIPFGCKSQAEFRASDEKLIDNQNLQFTVSGKYRMCLKTLSSENVYNALAVIACARLLKISFKDIGKALRRFQFPKGRQMIHKVDGFWVIDDTYNANPISFKSAVMTLSRMKTEGRRILVCADMLELGRQSEELHRQVGQLVGASPVDLVLSIGKFSKFISQEARSCHNRVAAYHFNSLLKLHKYLKDYCRSGDVILIKGSRGMHMERTVDFLLEKLNPH